MNEIQYRIRAMDRAWFDARGIDVASKGAVYVLNYRPGSEPNEHSRYARGLVMDRDGRVLSLPFVRFFNAHESYAAAVDIGRADAIEKMDGCLVGLYFLGSHTRPVWHTRKMLSTWPADMEVRSSPFRPTEEEPFILRAIGQELEQLTFVAEDVRRCYAFEFVHPITRVVTAYPRERVGLHLLNATALPDLGELSEVRLDQVAQRMGVARPRRWRLADLDSARNLLATFPPDYEGWVFRCPNTGNRVKLKNPSYLIRHRSLGQLRYKTLIPLWLAGEAGEIAAVLPDARPKLDAIAQAFDQAVRKVTRSVAFWRGVGFDRPALAKHLPKNEVAWVIPFVFALIGRSDENIRENVRRQFLKAPVDKVMERLGLSE